MLVCLHYFMFSVMAKQVYLQSHGGPFSLAFPVACFGVSIHTVCVPE